MASAEPLIACKTAETRYKKTGAKNKNRLIISNNLSIIIYISKIKTKILKTINKF